MSDENNYDELLYQILHNEGHITGFLDTVFSFLSRRTDFYTIRKPDNDANIGLPLGTAEKLVKTAFCKYFRKALEAENSIHVDEQVPVADQIVEITSPDAEVEEVVVETEVSNEANSCSQVTSHSSEIEQNAGKIYQSDPDCYNGAVYDDYSWSQSIRDVDVLVKVPDEVISAKQVQVCLSQAKLKVEILQCGEWKVLVDGDLRWIINVEESIWTLVPHKHIHVCLEKTKERWWDALFDSEPKIDVKNIDASQSYEDLDEDSQAKIRELMFNEQQKRLGKPTIEQSKITEVLRDAWDLKDSPFRGQPFDPNIVCSSSIDANLIPQIPK